MPGPTAYTDFVAAERLTTLREDRGLEQEGLAKAIRRHALKQGWLKEGGYGAVSADTIRSIEKDGHYPSLRVQLALALFFGVDRREWWKPQNRRPVIRTRVAA